LLVAIKGGMGRLDRVIAQADGLSHAIPAQGEWAHACDVLGRLGLIRAGDDCPVVTPQGRSIVEEAIMGAPSSYGAIGQVLALIQNRPQVGESLPCPSEDELAEAYEAYNARFSGTFEQVKKQGKGEWPWSR
jgi:hypothetical protein